MSDQFSNQIIARPFEQNYPTACGFLAYQQSAEYISRPIGFSLVRLIGNYYQIIEVVEMIDLELERDRVINFIINWSERVPFSSLFIDKDNYLWFTGDRRWQNHVRSRQLLQQYPTVRPVVRQDDLILRQADTLNEPIKHQRIQRAANLTTEVDGDLIKLAGKSPSLDALAGATEQIIKIQARILRQVADEQQRIQAAHGRSVY